MGGTENFTCYEGVRFFFNIKSMSEFFVKDAIYLDISGEKSGLLAERINVGNVQMHLQIALN